MKLCYAVLCLIALPVHRAVAQKDHAPTIEQCRADWNLWVYQLTEYNNAETARLESGIPDHTELHGLTMAQLAEREQEMRTCAHVDPSKGDPSRGATATRCWALATRALGKAGMFHLSFATT